MSFYGIKAEWWAILKGPWQNTHCKKFFRPYLYIHNMDARYSPSPRILFTSANTYTMLFPQIKYSISKLQYPYLRVLLAYSSEQVVDEPADQPPRVVYPGYQLGDHLQPGVNVNGLHSLHQGLVDVRQVAIVKPQGQ